MITNNEITQLLRTHEGLIDLIFEFTQRTDDRRYNSRINDLAFDEGLVGNVISDEENGRGGLICLALKGLEITGIMNLQIYNEYLIWHLIWLVS